MPSLHLLLRKNDLNYKPYRRDDKTLARNGRSRHPRLEHRRWFGKSDILRRRFDPNNHEKMVYYRNEKVQE